MNEFGRKTFASTLITRASALTRSKQNAAFAERVLAITKDAKEGKVDRDEAYRDLIGIIGTMDETHRKESTTRKMVEKMSPFVDSINRFAAVVDTMVQSDPTPGALIWGTAKMFLQVCRKYERVYGDAC